MKIENLVFQKNQNKPLSKSQITRFIKDYTADKLTDEQVLPLVRAIYELGMDFQETYFLADAMAKSGKIFTYPKKYGLIIDKHSTGGVGDKVTPAFAAAIAAANAHLNQTQGSAKNDSKRVDIKVGKVSGKALGHTGGTVDKLKSVTGFRTDLTESEFLDILDSVGIAIIGQTSEMVPADKKLYALRDKSGLIDSVPLIASSVMSKKIAAGAKYLVLDVKAGNGAFMKDPKEAQKLARAMLEIAKLAGIKAAAVISSMDQPLGRAIGNRIEMAEVKDMLRASPDSPDDLKIITIELTYEALRMCGVKMSRKAIAKLIENGEPLAILRRWMIRQGASPKAFDQLELSNILSKVSTENIRSIKSGYISSVDTSKIGDTARFLKGKSGNDNDAGIIIRKKIGERVAEGDILLEVFAKDAGRLKEAVIILKSCLGIARNKVSPPKLVYKVLRNYP